MTQTMPNPVDYGELGRLAKAALTCGLADERRVGRDFRRAAHPSAVLAVIERERALIAEREARDRIIARLVNWITGEVGGELPFIEGQEADEDLAEQITARQALKEPSHG